ncbi:MAG TPA: ABC transporter ATP-binding protein [Tepidisphaeraceae bacterium]|jgi:ABC-type multidrug transport system fused ATPase/permease subunit
MAAEQSETKNQPSDTWPIFGRLLRMLRPWWGMISIGVLFLFLSMPGEVFPAIGWKYVVDDIVLNQPESPWLHAWFSFGGTIHGRYGLLFSTVAWIFLVYVSCELFGAIETNILNRIAQQFILKLRNQVYHKLQSQSLGYLQRQRTGDLMSRALSDVDELQSFIVNSIDTILGEGVLWLIVVAIVMWMSWKVAMVSLAPLLLVYVLLRYFNKWIKPIYKSAREKMGEVSTRIQENLSGIVTIKIFGREKQEAERFAKTTEEYYGQQIKAINARTIFFPFSRVVGFFSNVFMIGFGGYYLLEGSKVFTMGTLVAFRAYWWRLFGPIQTLARVNDMIQRSVAAGRRVFEVLDSPDELPDAAGAKPIAHVRGEMELRKVSFAYATESTAPGAAVLHEVNVKIDAGKTIALCGPSGAGKSTVLNLLLRFYDPTSGSVTLDGIDVREIQRESLRKNFALVQQETFLFNDSILDNIRYGHPEATMQQVIAASQAANAHDFIERFPNGYQTKVGERGIRLSGGQKQRISIARGFLANPPVLLLDEPTSNVEPDSEAAIIAALDRLMAGRTTVLTSHRPSLINQADVVYVVENGRITEAGPPKILRQNGGWFANFMRSAEEAVI